MTDGGPLDHRVEDMSDDQLMEVLGHGLRAAERVPGDVVVDVEIDEDGTVVGQVAPPPVEWVEVHQAAAGEPLRIAPDERGRFRAPGVGHGPFRLLCRFGAGAPFPLLLTDWVTI